MMFSARVQQIETFSYRVRAMVSAELEAFS